MKKHLLAASLSTFIASTASALCQYPLDATASQYAGVGVTPFPYINLQSVEFTSSLTINSDGSYGAIQYMAASSGGMQAFIDTASTGQLGGDIKLPPSGIVAIELSMDKFPVYSTDKSNIGLTLALDSSDLKTFGFGITLEASALPGQYHANAFGVWTENGVLNGTQPLMIALPQPLPAGFRSGLYINMDTRQMGYTVNGMNYGYLKKLDGTPFTIPAGVQSLVLAVAGLNQVVSSTDANLGQVLGATLITDSSQFTQPFPAGATDICSANGVTLPTGKPFPGKGKAIGLQKVQQLLQQGVPGLQPKQ